MAEVTTHVPYAPEGRNNDSKVITGASPVTLAPHSKKEDESLPTTAPSISVSRNSASECPQIVFAKDFWKEMSVNVTCIGNVPVRRIPVATAVLWERSCSTFLLVKPKKAG